MSTSRLTLKRELLAAFSDERAAMARGLAHLGEFDEQRHYLAEGYPSIYAYCVGELHLPEQTACKRIRVARIARKFPAVLPALADGRLHLTAVVMLSPHLTPENVGELMAAAVHQSKDQLAKILAERFPRPDLPTRLEPIRTQPEQVQLSPGTVEPPLKRPTLTPLSAKHFSLQVTIDEETQDNLRYAGTLRRGASGMADPLRLASQLLVQELEKRKFAMTSRPRKGRPSANPRHIPAEVKRAVCERDEGQCTFVSDSGHRCEETSGLEFDHITPVARGGQATVDNIRLRCRAHNQYAAEQVFGTDFMNHKRQEAQRRAEQAKERDVTPWLRQLGFRVDEAKRAAAHCETIPDAPLEERLKAALRFLAPRRGITTVAALPAPA